MKAHELIEQHPKGVRQYDNLVSSVKFDLGHIDDFHNIGDVSNGKTITRPPYPKTLLQYEKDGSIYFVLITDEDNTITFYGYGKESDHRSNEWYQEYVMLEFSLKENTSRIKDITSGEDLTDEIIESYINIDDADGRSRARWWCMQYYTALRVLDVMACSNIEYIETKSPKFINNKRIKKGKTPIFSYKTLHIIVNNEETKNTPNIKGTHASPRVHLRRGHIRKLSNGKRIWIQPCVVGNKKLGMINKDYAVSMS